MGNQTARNFTESYVKTLTDIVNTQTNNCAASNAQVVSIRIIGSEDVNVRVGQIRQVATVVSACAQTNASSLDLQNSIDIAVKNAVKQAKDAINFNPGSQTAENVNRTAVEIANQVKNSLTNTCVATAGQAATLEIIDSKKINAGIDVVDQLTNVSARCTQNLSSITSIVNRVEEDFDNKIEQKQEIGLGLILIVIAILIIMYIGSRLKPPASTIIIVICIIVFVIIVGTLLYRWLYPPEPKYDQKKIEEKSKESNRVIDASITQALRACEDSRTAGYQPTQGFYWTFDAGRGPYVPEGKVADGKIVPRIRTGGAEGRPAGWQPSAVRQNAEILGVLYEDNETDLSICTRRDLQRPSIPDMARKIQGK